MARLAISLTAGIVTLGQERFDSVGRVADPVNATALVTDMAAFEAALAALVAQGASPSQADVTAANNAYTTLKADISAVPAAADVVVSINVANVKSRTALRKALDDIFRCFTSGAELT